MQVELHTNNCGIGSALTHIGTKQSQLQNERMEPFRQNAQGKEAYSCENCWRRRRAFCIQQANAGRVIKCKQKEASRASWPAFNGLIKSDSSLF